MLSDTDGHVQVLTLNRPESLNALNTAEWTALLSELRRAEDDPNIRAILIRAQGRIFCAGNDIKESSKFTKAEARSYFLDLMVPTLAAMASSRLPIIAEAHGMALGAGLELLQFCDVVIAAQSCRFQLPETRIGLWATVFLGSASYSANHRITQYLSLTAQPISAHEALAAHLVSKVVEDAQLIPTGWATATAIAENAPQATALSKAFANRVLINEAIPVVRDALTQLIEHTMFEPEGQEGMQSFIEKRPPHFN